MSSASLTSREPTLSEILSGGDPGVVRSHASGPSGSLPLEPELLLRQPSGDLFGLTQNAGMGWDPARGDAHALPDPQHARRPARRGRPADRARLPHRPLGGRASWCKAAAEAIREAGGLPFAAYCTDPCDGRTQGTPGMMDSLPYRNDAAMVMRRQIRSLPRRAGVLGDRDLRQGAARDDARARRLPRPAGRDRARRRDAARPRTPRTRAPCRRSARASPTAS